MLSHGIKRFAGCNEAVNYSFAVGVFCLFFFFISSCNTWSFLDLLLRFDSDKIVLGVAKSK